METNKFVRIVTATLPPHPLTLMVIGVLMYGRPVTCTSSCSSGSNSNNQTRSLIATVEIESKFAHLSCTVSVIGAESSGPTYSECSSNSSVRIFLDQEDTIPSVFCYSNQVIEAEYEFLDELRYIPPMKRKYGDWLPFSAPYQPPNWTASYLIDMHDYNTSTRLVFTAENLGQSISILMLFRAAKGAHAGGVDIYSKQRLFQADEDPVLVPCFGEFPHPTLVYEVERVENGSDRISPLAVHSDPMRGVHINLSAISSHTDQGSSRYFLCCSSEPRLRDALAECPPFCVDFLLEDPPDLVVSPQMPSDDSKLRFFTTTGNFVRIKFECGYRSPVDFKVKGGEPASNSKFEQTRAFRLRKRYSVNHEARLQVNERMRIECVDMESREILYTWNVATHDVAPSFSDNGRPGYLRFREISLAGGEPGVQCYSDVYKDASLKTILCRNQLECTLAATCCNAVGHCGRLDVSLGYICEPGNGTTVGRSCQEDLAIVGGLFICTAGPFLFKQLRWGGLRLKGSYPYDPVGFTNQLRNDEIIQVRFLPDPVPDPGGGLYTGRPYTFLCVTNTFWTDGLVLFYFGLSSGLDLVTNFTATAVVGQEGIYQAELFFPSIAVNRVICKAPIFEARNATISASTGYLTVKESVLPMILNTENQIKFQEDGQDKFLDCLASGQPPPSLSWTKVGVDGKDLPVSEDPTASDDVHVANGSVLTFRRFNKESQGTFKCTITSRLGNDSKQFVVSLPPGTDAEDTAAFPTAAVVGGAVAAFAIALTLAVLLSYYIFRWRRRVLDLVVLDRFRFGVPPDAHDNNSQNPSLSGTADMRPFNEEFEIKRGKFKLDKSCLRGEGEFGKVYQGTFNGNQVAIKVPHRNCPETILSGLLKEVKIMTYLQHENVVCLVGACTTDAAYGRLYILMEFCEEGSVTMDRSLG